MRKYFVDEVCVLAVFAFVIAGQVFAQTTYITDNMEILEGEQYANVEIVDSISGQTTVDMSGGKILSATIYDYSILNHYEGSIQILKLMHLSTVNLYGGLIRSISAVNRSEINLYGCDFGIDGGVYLSAVDHAVINIYGYDLSYTPSDFPDEPIMANGGEITGFFGDGTPMRLLLRDMPEDTTYSHVVFHEVPEPASLLLFGVGCVLLRRRR